MIESWASSEHARRAMQGNRSRDTAPELAVRQLVHARGLRYRVNARPESDLRRTADLVFRRARVAVFLDGCYWHGCPQHFRQPATNAEYWSTKIDGNRARDLATTAALSERGWLVLRYWSHQPPDEIANAIQRALTDAA